MHILCFALHCIEKQSLNVTTEIIHASTCLCRVCFLLYICIYSHSTFHSRHSFKAALWKVLAT